ncbi:MAG: glycosyltransferase family 2 protein [Methanomassiliicoccales archaeon]|jgi:glycosyltransferase involved in cell wall biosynthesis|nr:glycosyltransferase family 2 protein [Methanomassiliicoccales archaeon]
MKTFAVIPAFNERAMISQVIEQTKNFVDQIIVIDDGSSDDTATIARSAGAVVISHPRNMGVGAAFATGVEKALSLGADIVVTLDADGQFQPSDIPRLIQPIIEGKADFVTGSRFMNNEPVSGMNGVKRIGNRFFTRLTSWLTGMKFTDTQCGFRAYSKEALLRITTFGRFTYTQEVFLDLVNKNMRVVEVPIRVLPRQCGKSKVVKNPFSYGLRALKIIMQTERDHHPLRFFTAISMFFVVPSITMFAFVLAHWLLSGKTSPFTSLLSLSGTLFLVGIIFIVLALIADMQGRQRKMQEEILYLLRRQRYS